MDWRRESRTSHTASILAACALAGGMLFVATPAHAVPAFARQYGTSCETCHTTFPVLTPFGEAFRRNGFRFPGTNSDFIQQDPVPLGQPAYKKLFPNSVWPSTVPMGVPLAVGVNGGAVIHPDTSSSGGAADNNSVFTLADLAEEAHLWAAGPIDDQITYFVELTASEDGVEFEHASLEYGDIVGPKHWVNLMLGKFVPTLSSFAGHSSYIADHNLLGASTTELFGGDGGNWNMFDNVNGVEVNGVVGGWVQYAVGVNAGAQIDPRNSQNVYGMVGFKLGGVRLDGEPGGAAVDAKHPWAENSVTLDGFVEHSSSRYSNPDITNADGALTDHATAFGGQLRAQWQSLKLDAGISMERHDHAQADGSGVNQLVQWDELSYVALPWLVPAVRFEYVNLDPAGGSQLSDYRIIPGVAMDIRPNVSVRVDATFEGAQGAPPVGWDPAGGVAAPSSPTGAVGVENESVGVNLLFAF